LEAGYGALRRPIGNEVLPLWEWLPATTTSRQDAAPTGIGTTSPEARRSRGYFQDRVEVTATDKRGKRIEVMTITEWIIRLSIFGVLAMAVIGTVQRLTDAMKKKN
jgi:hypothetical protein